MVKRKGNLISSLCRMDNILLADTNARKAKRRSRRFIESAIIFWFKDADCKAENKVVEYLGEY